MINSFKDKALERCWREDECGKIRTNLKRRILMKLDSMDLATCIEDLQNPPSNHLHQLTGNLNGYWAIRVNGPWRLIFRWSEGSIYDVSLEQYH